METGTVEDVLRRGLAHHQAGRLTEAEALYRQVLSGHPDNPDALHLLGVLAHQGSQFLLAVELISKAVRLHPEVPSLHFNLANALRAAGKGTEAAESFRAADRLAGGYPEALADLGDLLREMGQLTESVIACRKAIALNSGFAVAWNNLGNALRELGQLEEGAQSCRRAISLKSDFAEAYSNLGACLQQRGQLQEAVEAYQAALKLNPMLTMTWNNLSFALVEQGRLDEAAEASRTAVRLAPKSVAAYNELANTLKQQGRVEEAVSALRDALQVDPSNHAVWGNLLHTLHYIEADGHAILREHLEWYRRCAQPLAAEIRPHENNRDPHRRLRIGYVSPDLRMHPVGMFLRPLLDLHDREHFEVICYSDVLIEDEVTEKLRAAADHWRGVVGVTDATLAELIRQDAVDILVDLAGHTNRNCLLTFARKPAPLQVTYLGCPSTTGLATIDYRLTDEYLDPSENGACYVERPLVLRGSYYCLSPHPAAPEVAPLPSLSNGYITFGCLNNFAKSSPFARQLWRDVLLAVPTSHLLMYAHSGSHRQQLREHFAGAGIDPDRVGFVGQQSAAEYFATYNRIDIALDSFPHAGGTTTCDALWMGAPVVTLAGRTAVQRLGVSILSHAGLPALIAQSTDDYIRIAAHLAGDTEVLASMRAQMRSKLQRSPLMDARHYVRGIEAAYRQIWHRWCEDKPTMR